MGYLTRANGISDEIGWDLMGSDENHAMLGAAANGSHMAPVIIQMNGWGNAVEKSALPRGNFGVTPWKTRGYPVEKSALPSMKTPRLQPALGQQVLLFASISVSYEEGSYVICIGQIGANCCPLSQVRRPSKQNFTCRPRHFPERCSVFLIQ